MSVNDRRREDLIGLCIRSRQGWSGKSKPEGYFDTYFSDYFTDLGTKQLYQNKGYLSSGFEVFLDGVASFANA
jgi:hypothetical protein